mmetsp:Transcript_10866/g.24319  ORF Transcript_10866/g.24319 Transcript_10866/m.24319 type:complete len:119 (-) Transcript_10866:281-637(-)
MSVRTVVGQYRPPFGFAGGADFGSGGLGVGYGADSGSGAAICIGGRRGGGAGGVALQFQNTRRQRTERFVRANPDGADQCLVERLRIALEEVGEICLRDVAATSRSSAAWDVLVAAPS